MNRSVSTPKIGDNKVQQPTASSIVCRSMKTNSSPTILRMGPPATLRNWKFHKPLLAVGCTNGTMQIFNLASGKLYRELSVHSYPVKVIEWIGLNAFISYAVSESFQGNDFNWELRVTELDTGLTITLKSGRSSETSVIQSVKASHLRQYFIVVYKNNPFEIWDLETLSLLRQVPKKFSNIVAAEWSPLYSKKVDTSQSTAPTTKSPLKENFVVTNRAGELVHFSITGTLVKEISKIPPESTASKTVTAIAWKSDHVVLGRNDGYISVWDLGQKESRTVSTNRGSIKKIRFAPGRGNMKIMILFDDGIDVWDAKRLRLVSTVTVYKGQNPTVDDADWAASDRLAVLSSCGTVVITDLELKQFSAASRSHGTISNIQGQSNDPCSLQ